jgi:uncharacterized protein YcaQ
MARRLAIARQRLSGERPSADERGILEVMRAIRCLQLDPINAVARSPLLVLWSRLGNYDPAALRRVIWKEKALFEYWAHAASLVLTEDYPIFAWRMQHYANGGWRERTRKWLDENYSLRQHILERLRESGPLAAADIEHDEIVEEWHSSGWTDRRTVNQMLDCMWSEGQVMVAGRKGCTRIWDLPERCLPEEVVQTTLTRQEAVVQATQFALRALGVATERHIREHFTRKGYPGLGEVLSDLLQAGEILKVRIEENGAAWDGEWFMHRRDLPLLESLQDGEWKPRTTLLSPFDNLICDRDRTEQLFDFYFRLEIYVPRDKRQYGYYVLPVLHGDRLIGRIDPKMDRKSKRLMVNAVYAEPDVEMGEETGLALAEAISQLASFAGAREVVYGDVVPSGWQPYLQSGAIAAG